jgi:DNA-binding GntR family transcriptional regulator
MKDSENAYEKILRMIVTTKLKPDQEIDIGDLIEELKIGKTPIREALIRLSYEGYVRILPRKGMLVSNLNIEDMDKLKDLRFYFVKFLSEHIIENSGDDEIIRIKEIQEKLRGLENTFTNCIYADINFHELTFELCNNKYAEEMMKRNLYLSIRQMFMKKKIGVTIESINNDYEGLIECIKNKHKFGLEKLLLSHILDN